MLSYFKTDQVFWEPNHSQLLWYSGFLNEERLGEWQAETKLFALCDGFLLVIMHHVTSAGGVTYLSLYLFCCRFK